MATRPGFFSRVFSKSPAAAAGAPHPQNVPKNANTSTLTSALRSYVNSLRKIRSTNPSGISRNNLFNTMRGNRNRTNRALQNYIMNVNKAKYLNTAAQVAMASPEIPETQAAPIVTAAAQANVKAANAYNAMLAQNLAAQVNRANITANALANLRKVITERLGTLNATSPQHDMLKNALNKINKKQAAAAINAYKTMSAANLAAQANRTNLSNNARAALITAITNKRSTLNTSSPQHDTLTNALNKLTPRAAAVTQPTPNNRFKIMNINSLIKATANAQLTPNNKTKLRNAINSKLGTLSENNMNRVRLVTALSNLN
jgi:hypothetical protein